MIEGLPSRSAQGMAMHRAAHQIFDRPLLFADPLAGAMIGAEGRLLLRAQPHAFRSEWAIRAFTVARSFHAENALRRAVDAGVWQYVVLAAGLDSFAYRADTPKDLRVIEVDSPATQAWKRARLREEKVAIPAKLAFVAMDLEKQALEERLRDAGFHADAPAFFSFLGAAMFLEEAAVMDIARFIGGLPPGSGLVFDYGLPASALDPQQRAEREHVVRGLAAVGEPVKTWFDPGLLAQSLRQFGFGDIEDIGYAEMNARFFAGRADNLRVSRNGRRLLCARVTARNI
ncbi:MAG TPA: SAM-dependent methyltransferase [Rhizomicrobium sp.]|nr:SAM-dependent methyltransferase [Rhizomicrobium sp.]